MSASIKTPIQRLANLMVPDNMVRIPIGDLFPGSFWSIKLKQEAEDLDHLREDVRRLRRRLARLGEERHQAPKALTTDGQDIVWQ